KVAVNNGFDVQELMLVGGDDEIEEPDELTTEDEDGNEVEVKTQYINPKAMKKAIKVRAQMLEQLKANPPKQTAKPTSVKAAKQAQKDRMKAGMKTGGAAPFDDIDSDDDIF